MNKRNKIAILTFPKGISITELIDTLTSYFSMIKPYMSASRFLESSGSHGSWMLHHTIYRSNSVTVTIAPPNNLETVGVQKASCVEKWHRGCNLFNNIVIEGV
jgi:hypothetical protein